MVAISFKADCEYKMVRIKSDNDGNVFILEIETMSYKIALVNIYGPRKGSHEFHLKVFEINTELDNEFTIIYGDFNLVQNQ